MHDLMKLVEMYKYYQEQHLLGSSNQESLETALKNAEEALDGIKVIKARDDEERKTLREKVGKVTNLKAEVKLLKTQLSEKSTAADQLLVVQNELSYAKNTISTFEAKIQKIEADKPSIRQRAVDRYLTSKVFCTKLQDRFDGG
ncbi:uncharacterized protein LOC110688794 [Chenopodium quinoa]|uniref:uncharacterized protein LOC110688794 n=1 Tax=Chenopodium quinoa TaxID=63459 RepID=UPI000B78429C|nr:uncharacterized protein LOC110688794 [Chenopodium quinoa]